MESGQLTIDSGHFSTADHICKEFPMNQTVAEKSFAFSVRIVNAYKHLTTEQKEHVMSKQLLRCGTSIGANIAEAQQAQSRADFLSKLSISLKEASETNYWLRLLYATGYLSDMEFHSLIADCHELEKMLTAIIKTTKQ